MPFQSVVNTQPAPAFWGDFADTNPRASVLSGPGGLVAGPAGVTIGRFAWWAVNALDADNAPAYVNNYGFGPVTGFVARLQQGLNTTYLSEAQQFIPAGLPVTLFSQGSFWSKNEGATQALIGQKAYAAYKDGSVSFAASGAPTTASATASTIAAGTAVTATGTIAGNVLTVGTPSTTIYPGSIVSGTGVATNTKIIAQLTGTTGGAGTYAVDIGEQSVASTTITMTPYVLDTTGGTVTGTV
eukprot:gene19158-19532_t